MCARKMAEKQLVLPHEIKLKINEKENKTKNDE